MTTRRITCACLLASACAWSSAAGAQDATPESGAAGPGRLTRAISWAESKLDGGAGAADGFYPEFAGLITGYPSVEERFDESSAPGLTQQPNYAHADVAIESDTRDVPGYPSRGGRHRASIAAFDDREFGRYSFRRVEVETSQYVPVSDRSVFSIRGRMDLSQTAAR